MATNVIELADAASKRHRVDERDEGMSVEIESRLTAEAARVLTDEVKSDAAALWSKLLALYQGGAHLALGYPSWGAYYEAEFGSTGRTGYRLLEAARVVAVLDASDTHVTEPPTPSRREGTSWLSRAPRMHVPESLTPSQNAARELVPVLREAPEQVPAVWAEVVEQHGSEPTAAQVREHVQAQPESERAPHRRPITDDFRHVVVELDRVTRLLQRVLADDRVSRNRETLRDAYINDLRRAQDELAQAVEALEGK